MRVYIKNVRNLGFRSRAFLLAILVATASLLNIPISKPVHAAIGSVSMYNFPVTGIGESLGNNITMGPDNNIWYTYSNSATVYPGIGKLTPSGTFTRVGASSGPYNIAQGSDGNLWYSEQYTVGGFAHYRIVNSTTAGTVLGRYNIPNDKPTMSMTLGPDGAVWFTERDGNGIGKITTSGVITEYSVAIGAPVDLTSITAGPDGNLWFTIAGTASYNNGVGKITTSGVTTIYLFPAPRYNLYPQSITAGPDGNLWFTQQTGNKVGKVTTSGVFTTYSVPTANSKPYGITVGSDSALWFTESAGNKIGRITTAGTITEYAISGANGPGYIITGPDAAVWFKYGTAQIGRMATELTGQTISFTSTAPTGATIDSQNYTPTAVATSGLPVAVTVDPSSSSVCSIVSGVVSYQSAGTCTLNANQGGDSDYKPALQVQQSFTVAPVDAESSVALNCPSVASIGDTVTCTITLSNNGPAASENAALTALFPSSLTGASLAGGGTLSGQNITWTVPSLAPGDSITLTLTATASVWGKAKLSAALLQTSPDPDNSNNLTTSTITVH